MAKKASPAPIERLSIEMPVIPSGGVPIGRQQRALAGGEEPPGVWSDGAIFPLQPA